MPLPHEAWLHERHPIFDDHWDRIVSEVFAIRVPPPCTKKNVVIITTIRVPPPRSSKLYTVQYHKR